MDLQPKLEQSSLRRTDSEAEAQPIDPTLPLATKVYLFAERHIPLFGDLYIDLYYKHTNGATPTLPNSVFRTEIAPFILHFSELSDLINPTELNDILHMLNLNQETFAALQSILSLEPDEYQQIKDLCASMAVNPKIKETFAEIFNHRKSLITLTLKYQQQEDEILKLSIKETFKLVSESSFFNKLFTIYEKSKSHITVEDLKASELKDLLACIDDPENHALNSELDIRHPIFRYGCESRIDRLLTRFNHALLPIKEANEEDFKNYLSLQEFGEKGVEILLDYFEQSILLATDAEQFNALLTIASESILPSRFQGGKQLIMKLPPHANDAWIAAFVSHPQFTALELPHFFLQDTNHIPALPSSLKMLSIKSDGSFGSRVTPAILAGACQDLYNLERIDVYLRVDNLSEILPIKDFPIKELDLYLYNGSCNPNDLATLTPFFTQIETLSVNIIGNLTPTSLSALSKADSLILPWVVSPEETPAYAKLGEMSQLKSLKFDSADNRAASQEFCDALQKLATLESLTLTAESSYDANEGQLKLLLNNKPNLRTLILSAPGSQITELVPTIKELPSLNKIELEVRFEPEEEVDEQTKDNLTRLLPRLAQLPNLTHLTVPYLDDNTVKMIPTTPTLSNPRPLSNLRCLTCYRLHLAGATSEPDLLEGGFAKLTQLSNLEHLKLEYYGWDEDRFPNDFLNEGAQFHLCLKRLSQATSLKTVSITFENYLLAQEKQILNNIYPDLQEAFDLDITISGHVEDGNEHDE